MKAPSEEIYNKSVQGT